MSLPFRFSAVLLISLYFCRNSEAIQSVANAFFPRTSSSLNSLKTHLNLPTFPNNRNFSANPPASPPNSLLSILTPNQNPPNLQYPGQFTEPTPPPSFQSPFVSQPPPQTQLQPVDADTLQVDFTGIFQFIGSLFKNLFKNLSNTLKTKQEAIVALFTSARSTFNWFQYEVELLQCASKTVLESRNTNRGISLLSKFIYEFLGFLQRTFGGGPISPEIIHDTINYSQVDSVGHIVKKRSLKGLNGPLKGAIKGLKTVIDAGQGIYQCGQTYLSTVLIRVLRLVT